MTEPIDESKPVGNSNVVQNLLEETQSMQTTHTFRGDNFTVEKVARPQAILAQDLGMGLDISPAFRVVWDNINLTRKTSGIQSKDSTKVGTSAEIVPLRAGNNKEGEEEGHGIAVDERD
ncbi:hypothetical protein MVEN_01471700 [Mycena venus]|uniref:Uncharacterized protein n=1 Tax=Mycena venus TaxID=2733690 RepID=A0A8H7CT72_9AGAR|nr:hypothetical protein MVEN_01471700 [Mycena venus]